MAGERDHVAQFSGGDYEASCQPMRPSETFNQDSEVDSYTLPKATTVLRTEDKAFGRK